MVCKICFQDKNSSEFEWHDNQGQNGISKRCRICRKRGKQRDPNLPFEKFRIRRHAVIRYIERIEPDLTYLQARDKMIRLMDKKQISRFSPWWHAGSAAHDKERLLRGYFNFGWFVFVIGNYPGEKEADPRIKTVLVRPKWNKIIKLHCLFYKRKLTKRRLSNSQKGTTS